MVMESPLLAAGIAGRQGFEGFWVPKRNLPIIDLAREILDALEP